MLLKGNCLDLLAKLPDNSVDSIVTDPPYELGFMGKSWDNSGIAYSVQLWTECLRVLKPGGHLFAFGGSRTYHRLACAVEDAGFEVRDQIMWLYGSGFPKSLDVSKAIDKSAGAEREVVGSKVTGKANAPRSEGRNHVDCASGQMEVDITAPATPEAQQWAGWGTALKPAHEPIIVARKPLSGTVASNVLEWGVGALNIDGSRVGTESRPLRVSESTESKNAYGDGLNGSKAVGETTQGRWPANVIHDGSDEVLAEFPTTAGGAAPRKSNSDGAGLYEGGWKAVQRDERVEFAGGSAARFFYCAKASKSERNAGLEGLPETYAARDNGFSDKISDTKQPRANFHPTVKPIALMRYLVKMVTPPSGTVLDPFLGSGTTACAAIMEGFEWIGCEMTEDYWPIIEARVLWAESQRAQMQEGMF